jgi:serine/threonine protein phosphatase PrpC
MRCLFLLTITTTAAMVSMAQLETKRSIKDCPPFGCVLSAQDVHYNTDDIKSALKELRQTNRIDKSIDNLLSDCSSDTAATLTLKGYKGGPLSQQINQDRAFVVERFHDEGILVGAFDGHAPRGELVSDFVQTQLPILLSEKLSLIRKGDDAVQATVQCLIDTFIELDEKAPAEESGGCTATVVLTLHNKVYLANAGDSQSFLVAYRPSTSEAQVIAITREDKPDLPDERERVEAAGGTVYISEWEDESSRVVAYNSKGVASGLAMSRSIGDWDFGKVGVVPDPIVQVFDLDELVEHVLGDSQVDDVIISAVSATDGMMDYLSPVVIAQVLAPSLGHDDDGLHLLSTSEHLIFAAANEWELAAGDEQGETYRDDISIAVGTIRLPPERTELKPQ